MKIAVCVKEVPDATAPKRIDPGTKRLDRSGENTINPYDCARPRGGRAPEGGAGRRRDQRSRSAWAREGALRTLRQGALAGRRRWPSSSTTALEGADSIATARALAAAAELGADLVLLGQQASDSDSYVMAAAVAEHLERPLVTQVAGSS